ncbi:MAG TPA: hypothetical protein VK588_11345 [Chitinophagaceae bacterium]|nr:hypothetical protein [Chitinophagaceae bacterium]
MNKEVAQHLSEQISKIYDILISITERVEIIEKALCQKCNEEKMKYN